MNHEFEPVACRSIVIFPFEDVSGLAVECLADGVQRGEADGFGTSVLQNGHVGGSDANLFGELADANLAFGHHDVEIDANRHLKSPARVRARAGQGEQFPYGHERRFDAEQEQHAHNEIWPVHRRLARVEAGQRAAQSRYGE